MNFKQKLQKIAVFAFLFSINFETLNLFGLGIDFLSTKITIVFLFIVSLLTDKKLFYIKPIFSFIAPLLIYFALLTFISYNNINFDSDDYFDISLFLNIMTLIIFVNISKNQPNLLHQGLLVFAFSTFILSVLYFFNIGTASYDNRATIFNINANVLGVNASISILVFIKFLIENRANKFFLKGAIVIVIFFIFKMLILTGSRLSFIAFILGIIVYVFYNKRIAKLKKITLQFFLLFSFFFLYFFYLKDSVVVSRIFNSINNSDLNSRDLIWQKVFDIISNNLIFGVGKTGYIHEITIAFKRTVSPHNVLLEVLSYTGIVGFVIFLVFLAKVFKRALQKSKRFHDPFPLLLFIHIMGMILSGQIFDLKFVWFLISYIISFTIYEVKKN